MTRLLSIALLSIFTLTAQADIYSASNALSRGDYEAAVKEFTTLAEKGDANAQANLGYMYYAGEGVPQDFEQAVYWYRKAATQGNKDAQYNLAVSYAFGEGVKQDLTEAAIWYRRAGEQGHVVSQYSLGISYAYGEGVPQDPKEAARWFLKAAEQGYARAQVHLGSMYHTGEGVEQNYKEAVRWYRMAADRGDATAQYNLGAMYRSGKGVEQNYAQAKRWFRQSSDQGYAAATNELASLERSAAANVATRTIQAKPGMPVAAETLPEPVKEEVESVKEPIQKEEIVSQTKQIPQEPVQEVQVQQTKKEPLFTLEKEGLLTLDESELDIAEPEITPDVVTEPKPEQEIINQISQEPAEELIDETVSVTETVNNAPNEVVQIDDISSSPIHNALGIPAPKKETNLNEESKPSEGFFSKLFSKKESTDETEAYTFDQAEIAAEYGYKEPVIEVDDSVEKDKKQTDVVALNEQEASKQYESEENTVEVSNETGAPGGFFNRLFGSNEESESVETISEDTDKVEEAYIADVIEEPVKESTPESKEETSEIAALETESENAEVNENNWAEPNEEQPSKGFFSAVGEFFSGKNKETDTAELNSDSEEDIVIAKAEEPESIVEATGLAQKAENDINEYSIDSARSALTDNNYEEAYKQFQTLANTGNDEAQAHLGSLYYVGKGVNKDLNEAYNWYKKAADQGNVDAQYSIGNMYLLGEGVTQSNTEAAKWYRLASDQGHSTAQNNLRNLEKLEAINKENQLKLDALATEQKANEEEKNNAIEQQEDIASTETEIINDETVSTEVAINEDTNDYISDLGDSETIEEAEKEPSGFFSRLFGNNDKQEVEESVDTAALETSDEISEIENKTIEPEEVVTTTNEEIENIDEVIEETDETIATTTEEAETNEEESPGFFSRLFGTDKKDNIEEDIALADTEATEITAEIDATVNEEIVEDISLLPAIDRIRPLATQGDADAQYQLGTYYYSGDGVEQDYAQAALWYRRAAQQGNVDAQYSLGNMYLMGEGVGQNDTQAEEWYTLAAEQGHNSAKHNLESLQKVNTVATQTTEPEINNTPQLISLDDTQPTSTDDDSGKAIYEQALAYAFGDGVPQNDRTAFNLYYEAAEKGYVLAQYKLGVAFAYGEGVRQDNKQAAEWYRKAAEQGYTIAQRNLATMYLNGNGVEQNKVHALAWYEVVANAGNAMDLHRRDRLKSELSEIELNESLQLAKQISNRITNPSL